MIMKRVISAAVSATALLLGTAAYAADYPITSRRAHLVRHVDIEAPQTCVRGRFAYMRYAPVLATSYAVRPVFISEPMPCADPYGYR